MKTNQKSVKNLILNNSKNYKEKNNPIKETLKWLKRIIYLFLFAFALIGCFQQMIDPSIAISGFPGSGAEICRPGDHSCINNHVISRGHELAYNLINSWKSAWSHGPFYGIFVYPISLFSIIMIDSFKGAIGIGFAVLCALIVLVLLIRTLTLLFTLPQLKTQSIMQESQLKISQIRSKYDGKDDQISKQKMQQEIMSFYKKNNINPLGMFTTMFVTLPFLYSMYRTTSMVREIKSANLGPFSFSTTMSTAIFSDHDWIYIIPLIFVFGTQVLSFKLQAILSYKENKKMDEKAKKAYKKNQMVGNIMMLFFAFITITVPFALSIYWFISNIYSIFQTLGLHIYKRKAKNKKYRLKT